MLNRRLFLSVAVSLGIIAITAVAVQANEQVNINITYPMENQVVSTPVSIKGTISGEMPENQYMWVLVNPNLCPGQFWPQGDGHITPINDQWSWMAYLGNEKDGGNLFDVLVVLVDNATDRNLTGWVNRAKVTGNYPSIPFPPNAEVKDKVTLIRGYN